MSLTCSIPELTGLLTELYLLATTCLPASSLLLQRDPTRGIAPAHKLLIEILFFQLFTFPLLAWPEVRPVLTRLLTRTSPSEPAGSNIPPRITAVLSFFYFLYENSQLNTAESASPLCDLCDRMQQPSLQTRLLLHRDLHGVAADLAVPSDLLKQYSSFSSSLAGSPPISPFLPAVWSSTPSLLPLSQDRRAHLRRLGRGAGPRGASVAVERVPRGSALSAAAAARFRGSRGED